VPFEVPMPEETVPQPADIEVTARELGQLFNSLDPSPFRERDLDDDAEAYIVSWARELPHDRRLRILVHLPEPEAERAEREGLAIALKNYFRYRAGMLERESRERLRIGQRSLVVGLTTLAVCTTAAHLLRASDLAPAVGQFIAEGLIIFGWVANWRPAEIFLYDLWETRRTYRLYCRLAEADTAIVIRNE
jgi:hypothetical protein